MLACWDCRNLERFIQVSERGDARMVEQTAGAGVRPGSFADTDSRTPGLYCAICQLPVESDVEQLGLADGRVSFVNPLDFRAAALEEELVAAREDAEWSHFEWPAQSPRHAGLTSKLHPSLAEALGRSGRFPLYLHQAEAIDRALAGEHVIQATPAGSGKSLGLVVPVLQRLLEEPASTGLLIFPLRALANDQLNSIAKLGVDADPWISPSVFDLRLADGADPIRVARYDGSTHDYERKPIRKEARLIIATPDMLHYSVLRKGLDPYRDGTSWARFLRGLQCVVLDEVHTYQGVFGSNVSLVIRRLRRVAARAGRRPQFLCASATIGNPVQLAEKLTGVEPFSLVHEDGSGRARRVVLVCNPPQRESVRSKGDDRRKEADDGGLGRIAPQTIAIELIGRALASDQHLPVRTIAFARARNAVFQLSQRVRNHLKDVRRPELAPTVAPYAATFLSGDREEAESKLRDGSTLAVIATSALELGIDIPDLSLAVLVGYPGQISSFRQRVGRVGRLGEGLAVLIVGDDPLQQWLARDPRALQGLLDADPEDVVVNPFAPELARRFGLLPAQVEGRGIAFEDEEFFGPIVHTWLADVTGPPNHEVNGVAYWEVEHVNEELESVYENLRNASGASTVSVFQVRGRDRSPIGTIDRASAPRDCFVPAIWSGPEGDLYRVVGFDPRTNEVDCEGPLEGHGFITRGISVDRASIRADHLPEREANGCRLRYGVLEIARQVFGYKEQHFSGLDRSQDVERGWPPIEFVTDGLRVDVPGAWIPAGLDPEAAVRALEHVLLSVAPVLVACDPYDFDATSDRSGVYIYDSFGGGLRMSEPLFHRFDELASVAHDVIETCPCDAGCPSCVMLARRPDGNANLSKDGALAILRRLAERSSDSA